MAIALVASTPGASATVDLPSGWSEGDCHVVFAHATAGTYPTVPAGYTHVTNVFAGSGTRDVLAYKILTASEPGSTTWTSATRTASLVFSGVDPAGPIGAFATFGAASGTSVTIPPLDCTVTDGSSQIIGFWGHRNVGATGTVVAEITGVTTICETLGVTSRAYAGQMASGATSFAGGSSATEASNQNVGLSIELFAAASGGDSVSLTDITGGAAILDTTTIGQTHVLTPTDISGGTVALESSTIGQTHILNPVNVVSGNATLDATSIGQVHVLTLSEITGGPALLNAMDVAQIEGIVLTDITGGTVSLDAMIIGQTHVIIPSNISTDTVNFDLLSLTQEHILTLNEISGESVNLNPILITQTHILTLLPVDGGEALLDSMLIFSEPVESLPPQPKYSVTEIWSTLPVFVATWSVQTIAATYRETPNVSGVWKDVV